MWCQGERHGKEMEVMLKRDGWVNPLLLHLNRVNLLLSHLNRTSLLLTHLNPNSFQVKGTFFFLSTSSSLLQDVPECSKVICDVLLWCEIHRYGSRL